MTQRNSFQPPPSSQQIDQSQELVAIGAANIVSSFVRSYPATGSFSRTAVNSASGVETPMGGIVTGAIVILALQFLTSLFEYIPQAALASIIISSVVTMIDFKVVLSIFRVSKPDLLPYAISFFGTLFLGIEDGVGIAVGVNVLYLLYISARPGNTLLSQRQGRFEASKFSDALVKRMPGGIMVLQLGGSLMFPAVEHIKDMLVELRRESSCPAVIVDFSKVSFIDYTGAHGLQDVLRELESEHVRLLFCSVCPRVHAILLRMNVQAATHVFESVTDAFIVAQADDSPADNNTQTDDASSHLLEGYASSNYATLPLN
ncbi:hypothetical protein PTSG_11459 [Salpingoeca rosetta]|uniref:STAS domain-containing protein n=1 Tax=Salpingoeca rosetta (strain ATCC 50818 / BSB-021) TaxID=946362 RepID=F2UTI2_SALR5|nr:uncharacterized protein PTSG_11459 [Salpingoeca rosetta]EGD83704.1 hypothetical protein PTSG_11459 [Salpingoeca rosetta]|eukprot:XP_004987521.1 hypothetical protein PTSG_11459 [Salpingoeca rosetta]